MPVRALFPFLIFASLLFAGCQDNVVDRQRVSVQNQWVYSDTLKYDFEILDTSAHFDLVAEVEHRDDFPFQNLYTRIHTIQPPGDTSVQVVSLELAAHTGRWYGNCSGHNCTVEIVLQQNFRVLKPGIYEIWLEQYMRDAEVPGVRGISLVLRSADMN